MPDRVPFPAATAPQDRQGLGDDRLSAVVCSACGGDGWYVGHEDECSETGDCNCSGVQIECECQSAVRP